MAKNRASETLICDSMDSVKIIPETEREDILQCLKTIMNVNLGSCPMCRDVGVNAEPLHRRENVAKALLTRDVFVAVRDQEQRAEAETVTFEDPGKQGTLVPVLEVNLNG